MAQSGEAAVSCPVPRPRGGISFGARSMPLNAEPLLAAAGVSKSYVGVARWPTLTSPARLPPSTRPGRERRRQEHADQDHSGCHPDPAPWVDGKLRISARSHAAGIVAFFRKYRHAVTFLVADSLSITNPPRRFG
jgi:hypothetical protein